MQWNLLTVYPRSPGATMTPGKQQQWQQSNFSIANFSKNVSANICQYPDVSIGDRSDFNLNFSSELCKRVRHPSPHLTPLDGFGCPRIWMSGRVWHWYLNIMYRCCGSDHRNNLRVSVSDWFTESIDARLSVNVLPSLYFQMCHHAMYSPVYE